MTGKTSRRLDRGIGAIAMLILLAIGAVVAVVSGVVPSGADAKPPAIEKLAANMSLHSSLARLSDGVVNPLRVTDADLSRAVKLYAANCAVCHGAADAKPSTLSKGFYIESPVLAKDGVEDDPEGVTFMKLKHGIRFSAMPAFGENLSDTDLWRLTAFLKHMDKLPPAVNREWKAVPSAQTAAVR